MSGSCVTRSLAIQRLKHASIFLQQRRFPRTLGTPPMRIGNQKPSRQLTKSLTTRRLTAQLTERWCCLVHLTLAAPPRRRTGDHPGAHVPRSRCSGRNWCRIGASVAHAGRTGVSLAGGCPDRTGLGRGGGDPEGGVICYRPLPRVPVRAADSDRSPGAPSVSPSHAVFPSRRADRPFVSRLQTDCGGVHVPRVTPRCRGAALKCGGAFPLLPFAGGQQQSLSCDMHFTSCITSLHRYRQTWRWDICVRELYIRHIHR